MANVNTKQSLGEMVLSYGDDEYLLPVAKLNDQVRFALMQRTFSHIMGNEAASVQKRLTDAKDAEGDAKHTPSEIELAVDKWREEKIEAMISGEFGLRPTGPRMTSDERALRDIARDQIIAQAQARKTPMPKASDKEKWDAAIDKYLATPKLRAAADAELARRKAFVAPGADVEDLFA